MERMNTERDRWEVDLIVAAGLDGAIGRNGDLIWRIPADLRRFKSLTMGHTVIMGRKTWESLPKRPLPGRRNIVVSGSHGYAAPGAEVAGSPEEAMAMAGPGAFVIGGARLYETMIASAGRIHLTEIDAVCDDADARFPLPDAGWHRKEESGWETTEQGIRYRYVTLEREP